LSSESAKAVALPMKVVSKVMPFIWLLTTSTEFLLKVLQIKPTADGKVTEEEIKANIKEGTEGGEIQEIEHDIVERALHIWRQESKSNDAQKLYCLLVLRRVLSRNQR
jgi:CBS domain containing-hemolysin-like protein